MKLCTILLHASGYRPERALQHYRTIAALPLVLGDERKDDADYLETCRTKRNTAEYEMAGVATEKDASELVDFVKELRKDVLGWLKKHHTELIPKKPN